MTILKNLNGDKTQIVTKLKNTNCYKIQNSKFLQNSKTQNFTKLKNSNCGNTLKKITKLKNSKCDKIQLL